MWEELYTRLDIKQSTGKRFCRPTAAAFAACESKWKMRLPESYKSFVRLFGAGQIGGYFNICAPGVPIDCNGSLDGLIQLIRSENVRGTFIDTYGDTPFIQRMIPFADTIGGDVIVWDPSDIRNKKKHEYGIFVLPDDDNHIIGIAISFSDFVDHVCLGSRFGTIAGPKWTVVEEFVPFGRR